jgi:hypothetical protein
MAGFRNDPTGFRDHAPAACMEMKGQAERCPTVEARAPDQKKPGQKAKLASHVSQGKHDPMLENAFHRRMLARPILRKRS